MPPKRSVEQRLEIHAKKDNETGCWIWNGSRCKDGYGTVSFVVHGKKIYLAHRMTYLHFVGEIPDETEIDHICKNRACVNPDHLRAVSHQENIDNGDYKTTHRNRVKTRCKRGHELSGENLFIAKNGSRQCKECRNSRDKGRPRHGKKVAVQEVLMT